MNYERQSISEHANNRNSMLDMQLSEYNFYKLFSSNKTRKDNLYKFNLIKIDKDRISKFYKENLDMMQFFKLMVNDKY